MRVPTRCRLAFRCRANRDRRPRACASSTLSVVPPAASDEGAPAVAGADPDSVAASLGSGLNFDLILSLALFINLPGRQPGLFVLDIASATGSREQIRVHGRRSCALESAARDHVTTPIPQFLPSVLCRNINRSSHHHLGYGRSSHTTRQIRVHSVLFTWRCVVRCGVTRRSTVRRRYREPWYVPLVVQKLLHALSSGVGRQHIAHRAALLLHRLLGVCA